jgi:hypothetical protein
MQYDDDYRRSGFLRRAVGDATHERGNFRRVSGNCAKTGLAGGSGLDLNPRDLSIQPSQIVVSSRQARNRQNVPVESGLQIAFGPLASRR